MNSLFLTSPTLVGKTISLDLNDKQTLENVKKHPIVIKEGVEYR